MHMSKGATKDPIMAGSDKSNKESYGTANKAFNPEPELDDISHGSFQDTASRINPNITLKVATSSDEEEEEDTITPRAASPIDNEYVTHEGRSTFYGGTSSQGNGDPKYILDTVSTASEEEESKNNSKE